MAKEVFATVVIPWGDHQHGEVLQGDDAKAAFEHHPANVVRVTDPERPSVEDAAAAQAEADAAKAKSAPSDGPKA